MSARASSVWSSPRFSTFQRQWMALGVEPVGLIPIAQAEGLGIANHIVGPVRAVHLAPSGAGPLVPDYRIRALTANEPYRLEETVARGPRPSTWAIGTGPTGPKSRCNSWLKLLDDLEEAPPCAWGPTLTNVAASLDVGGSLSPFGAANSCLSGFGMLVCGHPDLYPHGSHSHGL
jgi:hypothetical protein